MAHLEFHPEFWLRDDAADAFNDYERAHGKRRVTSAGRTEAEQDVLIERYYVIGGKNNRPPLLYPPARPAKTSPHVANGGTAVDVSDHEVFARHSAEYGFVRTVPSDVVHFVYVGRPAKKQVPVSTGRATIRKGAKGPAVRELQGVLNRGYPAYSKLTLDGDFGPATDKVVREFQRRSGLTVDGIVGPATWRRLGL